MDSDVVKTVLGKNEDFIRRHLVLSSTVIGKLREHDVIGEYTLRQMMANRADTNKQLSLLFVCLRARGPTSFKDFLHVLRETFHGWIADEILDSSVDASVFSKITGSNVTLREVISKSHAEDFTFGKISAQNEQAQTNHMRLYGPYVPDGLYGSYKPSHSRQYDIVDRMQAPLNHMHISRRREYTFPVHQEIRSLANRQSGRSSPITHVPEDLRDLQRTFDNEAVSAQKSISILKQEEVTIKALLQQNLREQQDALGRQEALRDIKDKIKDINNQATMLFKPEPDAKLTKKRLSHLQKIPWSAKHSA